MRTPGKSHAHVLLKGAHFFVKFKYIFHNQLLFLRSLSHHASTPSNFLQKGSLGLIVLDFSAYGRDVDAMRVGDLPLVTWFIAYLKILILANSSKDSFLFVGQLFQCHYNCDLRWRCFWFAGVRRSVKTGLDQIDHRNIYIYLCMTSYIGNKAAKLKSVKCH